ncbi:hypothetical protein DFH09DRAFT_1069403 [Mycena vulgaris]|nr:hypothetical protein DFH09DRAFT_1069403 [Mycena vulgaris]
MASVVPELSRAESPSRYLINNCSRLPVDPSPSFILFRSTTASVSMLIPLLFLPYLTQRINIPTLRDPFALPRFLLVAREASGLSSSGVLEFRHVCVNSDLQCHPLFYTKRSTISGEMLSRSIRLRPPLPSCSSTFPGAPSMRAGLTSCEAPFAFPAADAQARFDMFNYLLSSVAMLCCELAQSCARDSALIAVAAMSKAAERQPGRRASTAAYAVCYVATTSTISVASRAPTTSRKPVKVVRDSEDSRLIDAPTPSERCLRNQATTDANPEPLPVSRCTSSSAEVLHRRL